MGRQDCIFHEREGRMGWMGWQDCIFMSGRAGWRLHWMRDDFDDNDAFYGDTEIPKLIGNEIQPYICSSSNIFHEDSPQQERGEKATIYPPNPAVEPNSPPQPIDSHPAVLSKREQGLLNPTKNPSLTHAAPSFALVHLAA